VNASTSRFRAAKRIKGGRYRDLEEMVHNGDVFKPGIVSVGWSAANASAFLAVRSFSRIADDHCQVFGQVLAPVVATGLDLPDRYSRFVQVVSDAAGTR
jgi:hypothetical protein